MQSAMDQPMSNDSTPPMTPQGTPSTQSPQPNPYQRIASRRAIACVTCAKAKTKCDKGLPHCSRCITKGIKCEPRSTRRTSDNTYRPSLKKPFVTPKRYNSTSSLSSLSRHSSPRSMLASKHRPMRAASHIDFRTAVKMSQQASSLSGFPTLTPLPTYNTQTADECRTDTNCSDHDSNDLRPTLEANNFLMSGSLTPQTPESMMYHEPVSMLDVSDQWMAASIWPDDALMPIGLGLECDMSGIVSTDTWSMTEPIQSLPITQISWDQSQSSISPQSMSSDLISDSGSVPPLSIGDYSLENFSAPGNLHNNNWGSFQFSSCDSQLSSIVNTPSLVPDFTSYPATMPTWENVFVPGPAPY